MTELPASPGVTVGWRIIAWKGEKRPCVMCGRGVRSGAVHHKDTTPPPQRVMCRRCYWSIMEPGLDQGGGEDEG